MLECIERATNGALQKKGKQDGIRLQQHDLAT
jgi:hypothetical protein